MSLTSKLWFARLVFGFQLFLVVMIFSFCGVFATAGDFGGSMLLAMLGIVVLASSIYLRYHPAGWFNPSRLRRIQGRSRGSF